MKLFLRTPATTASLTALRHDVRPYGANYQRVKVPHQEISECLDS
jgi:hypothetical protein